MSDQTIAIYNTRADDYAAMTEGLGEQAELEAFAAALPAGGRVLDLGCGPGFYAEWLAARGFDVDAVDGAAEMVALAASRPGVKAWLARFEALTAVQDYDGIWANFSLLHASRADLPAHLARIHRALRPGGLFHIGMKLGTGARADKIGRFYTYYSEAELTGLLGAAGFTPIARQLGHGAGLSGEADDYITILSHG